MKKRNRGFTLIELVVCIALISILSVTLAPNLRSIFGKASVSKVKQSLSTIRTYMSISKLESHNSTDPDSNENELLTYHKINGTPAFKDNDGNSYPESSLVVLERDNKGGWYYSEDDDEIYANLPNGAYTKDTEREVWEEEKE